MRNEFCYVCINLYYICEWFEGIHSVSPIFIKHSLIIPTKCTVFIHYIHLLYFSYLFRCHIYHHQGGHLCTLLKISYCYEAINYGVYSRYGVNYRRYRYTYFGFTIHHHHHHPVVCLTTGSKPLPKRSLHVLKLCAPRLVS